MLPGQRTALLLAIAIVCVLRPAAAQQYDLLIRNGHIVDGTGSPWYSGDIAIQNGHIAAIGPLPNASAQQTIDAHGLTVAPGFIDMLGQSETTILVDPHLPSKIFQGITTEITGEGESIAPTNDRIDAINQPTYRSLGITPDWYSLADYFSRIERQGMGINLASYMGATTARRIVIGDGDRASTPAELACRPLSWTPCTREPSVSPPPSSTPPRPTPAPKS